MTNGTDNRKRPSAPWALLLLLLVAGVGGVLLLGGPGRLEPVTDKVPMVAAALRGHVEFLDPQTATWKTLKEGDFIWEGAQIRVHKGGELTVVSDDRFSFSLQEESVLAVRRASKTGDVELGLDRGRLAARSGAGLAGIRIMTGKGSYRLGEGEAVLRTGNDGDRLFVGRGQVDSEVEGTTSVLGSGEGILFGEGGLEEFGESDEDLLALARHANTVGDEDGSEDETLNFEWEKKKLLVLARYELMENLSNRRFPVGSLAPNITINGITTTSGSLGRVVGEFNVDHTSLTVDPHSTISVTIESGGTVVSTGTSSVVPTDPIVDPIVDPITEVIPPDPTVDGYTEPTVEAPTDPTVDGGPTEPTVEGPTDPTVDGGTTDPSVEGPTEPTVDGGTTDPSVEGPTEPTVDGGTTEPTVEGPTDPTVDGGTTEPTVDGGSTGSPPPPDTPIVDTTITATVVTTTEVEATEPGGPTEPETPPPPPTCHFGSENVNYVLKLVYDQGIWKITDVEVATGK